MVHSECKDWTVKSNLGRLIVMTDSPHASRKHFTAKGADTRQRIIAAAAGLINATSVEATSIDDILLESETSKSQFYHYFADKEALVGEVIGFLTERVIGVQAPHLEALNSMAAFGRWRKSLVAFCKSTGARGCPLGSLAYELSGHSQVSRIRLEKGFDVWRQAIERGLNAMRVSGELKPGVDPAELSVAVLAALQGGFLLSRMQGDVKPLDIAFDMALSYLKQHLAD